MDTQLSVTPSPFPHPPNTGSPAQVRTLLRMPVLRLRPGPGPDHPRTLLAARRRRFLVLLAVPVLPVDQRGAGSRCC